MCNAAAGLLWAALGDTKACVAATSTSNVTVTKMLRFIILLFQYLFFPSLVWNNAKAKQELRAGLALLEAKRSRESNRQKGLRRQRKTKK